MYIEVENAEKTFLQNNKKFTAFTDVSLSIEKGEFICLLGPSGCGKSTLLNAIAGFSPVTSGSVKIEGKRGKITGRSECYDFPELRLTAVENGTKKRRTRIRTQEAVQSRTT